MPAPDDYTFLKVPDPTETVNKNIQMAINVSQAQQQQQQHQLQMQQMQNQIARQQQMHSAALDLAKNPSPQAITEFGITYPEASEAMARAHGMQSKDDQVAMVNHGLQMYNSLVGGRPDVAIDLATKWRDAYKAKGRDDNAQGLDSLIKKLKDDPGHAAASIGIYTSAADPEKWADNAQKATTLGNFQDKAAAEAREAGAKATTAESGARYSDELAKAQAGLAGSNAAVAAAGVPFASQNAQNDAVKKGAEATLANEDAKIAPALSGAKLSKEVTETQGKAATTELEYQKFQQAKKEWEYGKNALAPEQRTKVQDSLDHATVGFNHAQNFNKLADKLDAAPSKGGISETVEQGARALYGNPNGYSQLLYDVNDARNKYMMEGISTGRFPKELSDLLQSAVPPANAPKSVLAPFIRKLAVATAYAAKLDSLRGYWTKNSPNDPTTAAKDFKIPSLNLTIHAGDDYETRAKELAPRNPEATTQKLALAERPIPEGMDTYNSLIHAQQNDNPKERKLIRARLKASNIDPDMPPEVYKSRQNNIGKAF